MLHPQNIKTISLATNPLYFYPLIFPKSLILEKFINNRAKSIESDLNLAGKYCWNLIKGDDRIGNDKLSGLAPYMVDAMQEYVPKDRCLEMIQARPSTEKDA